VSLPSSPGVPGLSDASKPEFSDSWRPAPWGTPIPREAGWKRWGRHVVLFAVTAISVWATGAQTTDAQPYGWNFRAGLELAVPLLAILFAHEMGHYLTCRYYGVDATLPFFIPSPWIPFLGPLSPVGTFGAVIRIRSPFPNRRILFDIGIAGPIAGFLVCIPVLILGVLHAHAQPMPVALQHWVPGLYEDPLLLKWVVSWLKGPLPTGTALFVDNIGLAAWFGLFVTGLNLIPIGQLDGGHVVYALLGKRALSVSQLVWWLGVLMIAWVGPTLVVWIVLMRILGLRHPRTLDDGQPLGRGRVLLGIFGFLLFVCCFVPNPIGLTWSSLADLLRGR